MMADEEDIPANFPEEDNDLLEDEPVCKRRLLFYTLEQKKKIVNKAYSQRHHVQLTARKWQVQPVQIRRWRVQLQADAVLPAYPYPRTVEERTII
jgi:transposase-like protein